MNAEKRFLIKQYASLSVLFFVLTAIAAMIAFVGMPERENSLKQQVLDYSLKIADVYRGSSGDKALFLKNNFCENGELEQIAIQAKDNPEELSLIESLGRDCTVIMDYLTSEV